MADTLQAVAAAIALVITPAGSKHQAAHQRDADNYARIAIGEAKRFDLPVFVLVAMVATESRWDADAVNEKTGAIGLGQLLVFDEDGNITPLGKEILAGGWDAYREQLRDPKINAFLSARWLRKKMDQCHRAADQMMCALTRYGGHRTSRWARGVMEMAKNMEAGGG